MSNASKATGGIGITTVVGIVFVILKMTDNVDWSWFWVLLPWLLIPCLVGICVLLALVLALFGYIFGRARRERKKDPLNVRKW